MKKAKKDGKISTFSLTRRFVRAKAFLKEKRFSSSHHEIAVFGDYKVLPPPTRGGDESVVKRRKEKEPIIPSDFMGREMMLLWASPPKRDPEMRKEGKIWESRKEKDEEEGKEKSPFPPSPWVMRREIKVGRGEERIGLGN